LIEILGLTQSLKLISQQGLQFRDRSEGQIAHTGIIVPITSIFKDNRYSFTVYPHLTFVVGKLGKVVEAGRIELPSEETNDKERSCFSRFAFVS